MKQIRASGGEIVFVDDEDYDFLNQWKWSTVKGKNKIYAKRNLPRGIGSRKAMYMHREVLHNPIGKSIDHIDGNGLNNQKSNLRVCTISQNSMNVPMRHNNISGYKGVSWNTRANKYQASIKHDNRSRNLGYFTDPIDAAKAYDIAALKYFGEFAYLNFPENRP